MESLGFYTLKEASLFLNVSVATLKNWERQRIIEIERSPSGSKIAKSALHSLRTKINSGKIQRLTTRANKSESVNHVDPVELLQNKSQATELKKIKTWASEKELLLAVYIVQLRKRNIALSLKVKKELGQWGISVKTNSFQQLLKKIEVCPFDWSDSLLSYLHQYLRQVGLRNKEGSYFTPMQSVEKMLRAAVTKPGTFCDPCCGSGHFLLAATRQLENLGVDRAWKYVTGYDQDVVAVLVARAQLTLHSRGRSFSVKQIQCCDSLLAIDRKKFDYVMTNPPWGAKLNNSTKLARRYGQYSDSFEYFVICSLQKVRRGGQVQLILPEAFLNVAKYQKLRSELMSSCKSIKVKSLGRIFSGVFTSAIILELQQGRSKKKINQDVFTLASAEQKQLIQSMEANAVYVLSQGTEWALGVVSGDNAHFIKNKKRKSDSAILRGRDIQSFQCLPPSCFINLKSTRLQQKADLRLYEVSPKLVYRFIGRDLTFAIERKGYATLNSANIIVPPKSTDYSIELICGILNSAPAREYYRAKFNSLKVLRQHLEKFPFPKPQQNYFKEIEKLVRVMEQNTSDKNYKKLNALVAQLYNLNIGIF